MLYRTCALVAAGLTWSSAATTAQDRTPARGAPSTREAIVDTVRDAPQLTVFDDVRASLEDGVVTLTGKVTEPSKRDAVRRTVGNIGGVSAVLDRIAVLPDSRADDDLRDRLARSIYGDARFWSYAMMSRPPIRIIVEDGRVTLTGVVRSDRDRALAHTLARQSGAQSVEIDLRIDGP